MTIIPKLCGIGLLLSIEDDSEARLEGFESTSLDSKD